MILGIETDRCLSLHPWYRQLFANAWVDMHCLGGMPLLGVHVLQTLLQFCCLLGRSRTLTRELLKTKEAHTDQTIHTRKILPPPIFAHDPSIPMTCDMG